jgi:hypothetical protein
MDYYNLAYYKYDASFLTHPTQPSSRLDPTNNIVSVQDQTQLDVAKPIATSIQFHC